MSSGLYNEGLFREGLLRTTNLVRPGLITQFDTLEETLTRFAVNGVEAALALDFIASEYRTANTTTTFADAFTGTSPKLTYSTSAGSNSTMVNSEGKLVWAPHNLLPYSEDFSQSVFLKDATVQIGTTDNDDPAGNQTATQINVSGSGRIFANLTIGSCYSTVYLKPGTFSNFKIAGFSIDLGVTPPTNSNPDGSIDVLPNNWFRVTIGLPSSGRPFQVQAYPDDTYPVHRLSGDYQIWGAHVYRSDLGGMHPVPQSATGFEYYVPTNGNAEYLPRVGHHVYNGSTWVNEGLLIESEPRTNLEPKSEDFSTFDNFNVGSRNVNAIGPDGQTSATTIVADNVGGTGSVSMWSGTHTVATSTTYTFSAFLKAGTLNWASIATILFTTPANVSTYFDLENGVVGTVGSGHTATIQAVGNEWYRCSVTFTTDAVDTTGQCRVGLAESDGDGVIPLDGVSSIQVYGLQLDQGEAIPNTNPVQYKDAPTPSSYMPTSGGTYTRTAQSLTVPPAEFGWPEPEYIGPELVTTTAVENGGWTVSETTVTAPGTTGGTDNVVFTLSTPLEVGKVYEVATPNDMTANGFYVDTAGGSAQFGGLGSSDAAVILVCTGATSSLRVGRWAGSPSGTIGPISIREINPLSVSIQMDGRMTYADDGASQSAVFYNWAGAGANIIRADLATNGAYTGGVVFMQYTPSFNNSPEAVPGSYSPGVNVPYNISSRHGSTFIRGAADGVLANLGATTPTALPDLSSTNLQIASDFMGTIGQFRQFAGDIGDTGLVTATNPSTEPTLSLSFDGTDGSFYNLSWSE